VTAEEIIQAVCEVTGVSRADLVGLSRLRKHSRPRQLAVFLIYEKTGFTRAEFAATFSRHPFGFYRVVKEGRALVEHVPYVAAWGNEVLARLERMAA
jgi:hypothetical protein